MYTSPASLSVVVLVFSPHYAVNDVMSTRDVLCRDMHESTDISCCTAHEKQAELVHVNAKIF